MLGLIYMRAGKLFESNVEKQSIKVFLDIFNIAWKFRHLIKKHILKNLDV